MAKEIPVYLFVGFLESGKTKFIQETFEDPNFDSGDKTLLLICEEGEEMCIRDRASTVWGSVSAARNFSTSSYSASVMPLASSSAFTSGVTRAVLMKSTARLGVT